MKKLLHKKESGHLGQYEDWWYLVDAEGQQYVLHEWDHVTVNGLSHAKGEERHSLEDFLNGNFNRNAQAKLREFVG